MMKPTEDMQEAFKAIWDYYKGDIKYAYLYQRLAQLEQVLYKIENKTQSKKTIKLLDGRKKREEENE